VVSAAVTSRSPTPRRSARSGRGRSSEAGFNLVEIGMVTLIIGLLASIALPVFQRTLVASRASTIANDLRTFAAAFQNYHQQHGSYPPEADIGELPPAMADALGATAWRRITPLGGYYNWEYNRISAGVRYTAGIGIRTKGEDRVTTDLTHLLAIDRLIDDGDLATGSFFIGIGNEPFLAIER
jgi:type II secretory pathway pseudopilin PulG